MSTNDDEIDEAEATSTTTIEEEPPITFSEVKKDWYVKNKIQKKDCFHFIRLIDQIEEALYLDCHEKQKQSSIGDFFFFNRSEPTKLTTEKTKNSYRNRR